MIFGILLACAQQDQKDEVVTYYDDVVPILEKNCLRCHRGEGPGIGDFSNPETTAQLSELMLAAIDDGRMPPPSADPECHPYIGAEEMRVTPEDRNILAQWIETGKEEGEVREIAQTQEETITNPDLFLQIEEAYTPDYSQPDSKGNEYRCFVLEHNQTEPFYITDLYPYIDQAPIVHHIVLAKAPRDSLDASSMDAGGVDCMSGAAQLVSGDTTGSGMLSAWAPGAKPIRFEDGGILVQPDEVFILQMHYYQADTSQVLLDQSGYMMNIASSVENTILMGPYGYTDFEIPAGDASYSYGQTVEVPANFRIWATFPHMHLLGRGYKLHIIRADGQEDCVVSSDTYDFNNQLTYQFEEPILVNTGDQIFWECTWDNSAENPNGYYDPPQNIGYGERTDEEMCYAFTLISIGH